MAFGNDFQDDSELSEINMTPLVDVMLVLLIIFMLTVPVITDAVHVNLPQASSQASEQKPDTIHLSVDAQGQLFWNKEAISLSDLGTRLQPLALLPEQPELQLRGDKAVAYDKVAQVMATVQKSGMHKLGFVMQDGGQ